MRRIPVTQAPSEARTPAGSRTLRHHLAAGPSAAPRAQVPTSARIQGDSTSRPGDLLWRAIRVTPLAKRGCGCAAAAAAAAAAAPVVHAGPHPSPLAATASSATATPFPTAAAARALAIWTPDRRPARHGALPHRSGSRSCSSASSSAAATSGPCRRISAPPVLLPRRPSNSSSTGDGGRGCAASHPPRRVAAAAAEALAWGPPPAPAQAAAPEAVRAGPAEAAFDGLALRFQEASVRRDGRGSGAGCGDRDLRPVVAAVFAAYPPPPPPPQQRFEGPSLAPPPQGHAPAALGCGVFAGKRPDSERSESPGMEGRSEGEPRGSGGRRRRPRHTESNEEGPGGGGDGDGAGGDSSSREGCGSRDGGDGVGGQAGGATAAAAAGAAAAAAAAVWPPAEERLAAVEERLRALPREDFSPVSGRAAAVLVGLFEDSSGVVRVLLTQRSAKLKSHRGEVCLPGGKRDEGDADDVATALREAQEELGLDPARVTVLCRLPPVLSKHHLSVTPVLALLPPDIVPRPNPHEVAAAFTVPLAVFLGQFTDPRAAASGGKPAQAGGGGGAAAPASGKTAGRRSRRPRPGASAEEEEEEEEEEGERQQRPRRALSWRGSSEEGGAGGGGGGGGGGAEGQEEAARGVGRSIGEDTALEGVEHVFRDIRWGEHQYRIHSFQCGEYDVWGLTATICIDAARLALGRAPRFQERSPGGHHYSAFFWDGSALRIRPCASTAPSRALLAADDVAGARVAKEEETAAEAAAREALPEAVGAVGASIG
ncbi:hypothetical protein PLESTB_000108300 [Pleodorina starrii]|uniref:Nudix hydrolase domain-containing protein n=1 Tax=Pleodorina starrii TaxID=330485 RepID=A0A9W6BB73_9CHLO|nr:hypothetical protein PLESTM_000103800 [Pleodorina starrii]GLC48533.1 hypothetical protein PLESTB_000108300 [Pleodorina starrii]GLC71856.1 hypothetical protein PLESTF_001174300 [Pleodorina starrii]